MILVGNRARICSKPITQKYIIYHIGCHKIPEATIKAAIRSLVQRGYIRPAVKVRGVAAAYVQIRFI
jgi:hypothetical protein